MNTKLRQVLAACFCLILVLAPLTASLGGSDLCEECDCGSEECSDCCEQCEGGVPFPPPPTCPPFCR